MARNDLRIDLLGTSFSISADEDPVYLENLLNRYRQVIENTQRTTGLKDPLKISIIAGFLLCDDLQKLTERGQENPVNSGDSQEAEQLTQDLIMRLDRALSGL
jgi:cell division protein ZapA (FtsZ GTPase activity inhibitor)